MPEQCDFLAERRTGVGGSDLADLFSIPPWGCQLKLWRQKRGEKPDREREVTGPMKRGKKLEAIIAEEYAEKTDRVVEAAEFAQHPDVPQWMCHRDFVTWGCQRTPTPESIAGSGPLSIKTANRQVFYQMKREGLSEGYILQLQSEIGVTGAAWGSYAVLWPDNWQLLWFDQKRDDALIGQIREAVEKFWVLVENGPAPDRLPVESPQCHRCEYAASCQGAAMEKLMRQQGVGTVRDASLGPLVREYQEASALMKDAEDYKAGVSEELKASMGDRVLVEVPGVAKVHFKPNREWNTTLLEGERPDVARQFKTEWNLTALGKAHPELEQRYKRTGTTRPLRIYGAK